jgi:hypothetical protein
MRIAEAEKAIRYLCHKWAEERGLPHQPEDPNFYDFYRWVEVNSPGHLKFRSGMFVRDDVERWFADEFNQLRRY